MVGMHVILTLPEQRQEDGKFKSTLGYRMRPCSQSGGGGAGGMIISLENFACNHEHRLYYSPESHTQYSSGILISFFWLCQLLALPLKEGMPGSMDMSICYSLYWSQYRICRTYSEQTENTSGDRAQHLSSHCSSRGPISIPSTKASGLPRHTCTHMGTYPYIDTYA